MDPECDVHVYNQTVIVNNSLLPQEYNMEYVKYCIANSKSEGDSTLHSDKHNDKHIANGGHLLRNSKQQPFTVVESFVNPCIK